MKTVNIHEAKTNFSRILAEIEKSKQPIVICRNGKPVANLTPHKPRDRTTPHPLLKKTKILYDPVEGLTEDEWPKAYR